MKLENDSLLLSQNGNGRGSNELSGILEVLEKNSDGQRNFCDVFVELDFMH